MRTLVLGLGLAVLLSVPIATAHAQAGEDAEAHALFEAGEVAFGDGRYENALDYFQRSYELSRRPLLLYNIGAASDRLRRDADAIAAFEQYLAEVPDAPNRHEVEGRLASLRRSVEAAATASARTPDPEPEPAPLDPQPAPPAPRSPSAIPWVIVGVGAAAAIAGAVLVGLAAADVATVENAPQGTPWTNVQAAYGRSEGLSIAGFVCLGIGGAALAAGLGWGVVDLGAADEAPRVSIGPGGVALSGVF
jgi:tetratricopeptide (TPR) repeat protein